MNVVSAIRRMFRGEVSAGIAALEAIRRVNAGLERRNERANLDRLNRQAARLTEQFAQMSRVELLNHFRSRESPKFFSGFTMQTGRSQAELFPKETVELMRAADQIIKQHCWPLLGLGEKCFGAEEIGWHRDPLSGVDWPRDYHGDINLMRNDGSDARVVWELNRLGHLITLGRAYAITSNAEPRPLGTVQRHGETLASEYFHQIASWRRQNPIARGVNWTCAMEVALRAINLIATFYLFLESAQMKEDRLSELVMILDQHGAHIRRNLEYSHIATSNHYLTDVVGLLWLGLMFPELESANDWRTFGLREMLREMDKQVLPDGADSEASTGYHRLKVELFLYSFVLCRLNAVEIEEKYWQKLRTMLNYVHAYLRPDGRAPLIGDSDSGQVLPIVRRCGDEHAYLLAVGAVVFQDPQLKIPGARAPEELLWILGEEGVRDFEALTKSEPRQSKAFINAGIYILRDDDLYLGFSASDSGIRGRGSHGHNDALSIEVTACGVAFIIDPGTYVYTANLHERHLFRSTAYHSTVEIDGVEQNTINEDMPFVIGNEANPRVIEWQTGQATESIVAEHYGYHGLSQPVTHRRTVVFKKAGRHWAITDELFGEGAHEVAFRFHFAPGLNVHVGADKIVEALDGATGACLLIVATEESGVGFVDGIELESRFSSQDYGHKLSSISACWTQQVTLPFTAHFSLIPLRAGEAKQDR